MVLSFPVQLAFLALKFEKVQNIRSKKGKDDIDHEL